MVLAGKMEAKLKGIQKDKIPRPEEWTVEFYLSFLELMGEGLLRVIKYSQLFDRIFDPFNSNFIDLITKVEDPCSFDEYQPISLYNCIDKIIAIIISNRIRPTLFRYISREQFGFLYG